VIAQLIGAILAKSSEGGSLLLLALGPASAGGMYWGLFRYYRNTHQSHSFESETRVVSQPITGTDQKVDSVRGTTRTHIEGDNRSDHRSRVQRVN
jgi:hypothetical protein